MIGRDFVLAGEAVFTVEVPDAHRPDGKEPHYTYRVQCVPASDRWPEAHFVSVLTGPDNTSNYTYAGKLDTHTGQVQLTAKSAFPADSYRLRLLNRVLARLWGDDAAALERHGFIIHHEGRCGRCGRRLTTPESCEIGIGPECRKLMGLAAASTQPKLAAAE